jgi:hypothetical protein
LQANAIVVPVNFHLQQFFMLLNGTVIESIYLNKYCMKKVFTFCFSIVTFITFSQDWQWAKTFGDYYEDVGQNVGVDKDENVYITGYRRYVTGGSCQGCYHESVFYKLDSNGNLIWKKKIPYAGYKILVDQSGNTYVIANNYLKKYDKDGNDVWEIINSVTGFVTAAFHPDGGFIAAGTRFNQGNVGTIARYDENGNKLWEITAKSFGTGSGGPIAVANNGIIYYAGGYNADTNIVNKGILSRVSSNGSLIEILSIPPSPSYIEVDGNENFYLTKGGGGFEGDNGIEPDNYTKHLLKYNVQGELLFQKRFNGIYYDYPTLGKIHCNKDNSIILSGNFDRKFICDSIELNNIGDNDIFVTKMNENGKILWIQRTNGNNTGSSPIYDMNVQGSSIFVTGLLGGKLNYGTTTLEASSMYGDVVVAKLKDNQVVKVKENDIEQLAFSVFPNPTGGLVNINYSKNENDINLKVINVLGALVYNTTLKSTAISETLDLRHLKPGAYFIILQGQNGTETKKIIVQ